MSDELKPCSFCKSIPQAYTWILYGITETRYFCPNPDCPHSVRTVTLEQWNTRPIEDALNARIAELEEENDRLQDGWFRDETICPDGSLRPKVSDLLNRIAELEAEGLEEDSGSYDSLIPDWAEERFLIELPEDK